MSTYLVTGGAGFIGAHLVRELLARGEEVRVIDSFVTGTREDLRPFLEKVKLFEGSIENQVLVEAAMQGVDFVLHQAALGSVPRSVEDPLASHAANLTGTLVLLEAARRGRVRRFVYASSSSVYGDTPDLPKVESMAAAPLSPYAVTKRAGELYCRVFHRIYGLETVSLRYFNVFGPGQRPDSKYAAVVPRFMAAVSRSEPPVIFGDGQQSRDFTFIENVVQANLLSCTAPSTAAGEAFNIAGGESFTLLDLLREMESLTGKSIRPRFEASRKGDVRDSLASIQKAADLLGYRPVVSFREGLRRTLQTAGLTPTP
ncbi:MAG: LPS biosynthesis protein WbpP [Acidobacteria bacterium]|nr:MAG: LPS biosynthesis protein WbpP [Acidobacteriota bacterium]